MKYLCKLCKTEMESVIKPSYCSQCGGQNCFEEVKQEEKQANNDIIGNVYKANVMYAAANGYAVQFSNGTYGILNNEGKDYSSLIGQNVNCTVVGIGENGYPLMVLGEGISPDPQNNTSNNDTNNTNSFYKPASMEPSSINEKNDINDNLEDDADFDTNSDTEWLKWWNVAFNYKRGVSHKSAILAMAGLRNYINDYIAKRNDLINKSNNEKVQLDNSFNSEKSSINEEYNKALQVGQSVFDARINTNNQKRAKNNDINGAINDFVNGIGTQYSKARSYAYAEQSIISTILDGSQSDLQRQMSLITEFKTVDQKICELRAQSKLAGAQLQYDTSRKNIDDKYLKLTQDYQKESDAKITNGMNADYIKKYSQAVASSQINETKYESPSDLPEYIKLGNVCMDINSNMGFNYTDILHTVERQLSGIIDKRTNDSTVELPYCQRLMDGISLLVKYNDKDRQMLRDKIQPLLLKLFMYFPAGKLEATMIDPLEMGTSFQGIPKLAGITNDRIIDTKIWSKEQDIEEAIATLRLRMETINQSYGGDRRSRFAKEPVRVLAITDFPVGFSSNALKDLHAIVRNSATLGVCVLIWANNTELIKFREKNESLYNEIENNLVTTSAVGEKLYIDKEPQLYIKLDSMTDIIENNDSIIESLKTNIDHSVVKIEKFADMFNYDIEDSNKWFTGNDHEICIPLGIKGADTVVSMILGKGGGSTEHHVLIAGQTGAGKTTLLHTLIMSTLIQYSPDDVQMYLVDFKEGVEFKPYTKYKLPSLRVVAIDSEREFGLNILNELCTELEYRADIFAREDVEDINDYNDKPYVEKVPKLLLIFDEVQELFRSKDENDKIASQCLSAINKLVTQGRAMGIHIILACQDFSHCQGLQSYFSQMAVRIAVKGSEESAASILNSDNQGVKTLQNQPAGSAIYNRGGGVESANTFFQVSYMDKEERLNILGIMHDYYSDSVIAEKYKNNKTRIMLTNAEDNINNKFNQFIFYGKDELQRIGPDEDNYGLFLGQGFGKNIEFFSSLGKEPGENLLIAGKDEKMAMSLFEFSAMSLLYDELFTSNDKSNTLIYISDLSDVEIKEDASDFQYLSNALPDQITNVKMNKLQELIDHMYQVVLDRKEGVDLSKERVFLLFFGINRAKKLTSNSIYDSENQEMTSVEKLISILRYGPEVGINTIIWTENMANLKRVFGNGIDAYFEKRIAYKLPKEEMYDLVSEDEPENMHEGTAVYMNISTDIKNKHFRPFIIPSKIWIDNFADVYASVASEEG